jgi:hypothetical protein
MERVLMMDCGDSIRRAENGSHGKGPIAKTASYAIKATQTGTIFTNSGATGAVTFSLPTAKGGMRFTFIKVAAQNLLIKAAAGNKINGSTAGKVYQNVTGADAGTGTVTIFSDGTDWYVLGSVGTWAVNNT